MTDSNASAAARRVQNEQGVKWAQDTNTDIIKDKANHPSPEQVACLVYLDDIIVSGRNLDKTQSRLDLVMTAFTKANLILKWKRVYFKPMKLNI